MANNEERPRETIDTLVRALDRENNQQSRRSVPQTAADLLGPGYSSTAVRVDDWNSDEASFPGQFWSPIGAANAPDSTNQWIGLSLSYNRESGVQLAFLARSDNAAIANLYGGIMARRRWYSLDGGASRMYFQWMKDARAVTGLITPLAGASSAIVSSISTRGGVVTLSADVTMVGGQAVGTNGVLTAPLTIANMFAPEYVPNQRSPFYGMDRTYVGYVNPNLSIYNTVNFVLTAITPGPTTIPAGSVYRISSTYVT